ncbi:hypothetical protein [Pseudonocardia alaniniphila]|nr:hypothetical protein [Pseudonocardia alaniniphila]
MTYSAAAGAPPERLNKRLDGVVHGMQLEAPERINEPLLDFLSGS